MEDIEEFDLFMASINKSNRSSSPTPVQYSTSSPHPNSPFVVNHQSNHTQLSPKKTRSYRRKNNIVSNQLGKKYTNKCEQIKRKTKCFAGKDNNFMNSIPSFTGVEKMNIDVEQFFIEEIFETNCYATQCNEPTFNLTLNDLNYFLQ